MSEWVVSKTFFCRIEAASEEEAAEEVERLFDAAILPFGLDVGGEEVEVMEVDA